MPADESDIRAVLREHGVDVPNRGRLSAAHRLRYEEITGRTDGDDTGDEEWDGPDDDGDGDVTTASPPPDPGPGPGADGDSPAPPPERRPRRVRQPKTSLTDRVRQTVTGKPAKKRTAGKPKHPRVPVDRIIGRFWETGARLFAPLSIPVSRTLALQAPVAGLILEDTVRGTIVDRALQPVARAEERAQKVIALAGPPLVVLAIERAQGLEEPRRSMQLALLEPMLVESLTMWVQISGDKIETARQRIEADQETRQQVQDLIGTIFPRVPVEDEPQMAGQGM